MRVTWNRADYEAGIGSGAETFTISGIQRRLGLRMNGRTTAQPFGAHTFAEKIEELSGGHITIDLYINGTLGSEAESMQGIRIGSAGISSAATLLLCPTTALN